jgi:hypothetical protein
MLAFSEVDYYLDLSIDKEDAEKMMIIDYMVMDKLYD